jgi:sugar/nucleoside kinase (ribokinase family)
VSILVVGTVAFDAIETPFGVRDRILGGSATYIGLSARYFTPVVRLVAVVGHDFPHHYFDQMRGRGLDLDGVKVDPEGRTFFWAGRYHYDLNRRDTLDTQLNVLQTFRPDVPGHFRDSRIVCLGNLDPVLQQQVLDQMTRPALVVMDTMNYWINHTPAALRQTLQRVDCLIVNEDEARQLANDPNLIRAARTIQAMGPRILIIKKGEHGALLFCEEGIFSAPAYPLEDIEDPTGAGDTFMGGFAGALDREARFDLEALKRAVIYGSAMASFCVERFGPERLFDLEEAEVSRRAEAFRRLSEIPALEPLEAVR